MTNILKMENLTDKAESEDQVPKTKKGLLARAIELREKANFTEDKATYDITEENEETSISEGISKEYSSKGKGLLARAIELREKAKITEEEVEQLIKDAVSFARNSKLPLEKNALEGMYAVNYSGFPAKGW